MPKKTLPIITLRLCWRTLTRSGPSRAFSEAALVSSRSWAFNLSVYQVNAHLLLKKKFFQMAAKSDSYYNSLL